MESRQQLDRFQGMEQNPDHLLPLIGYEMKPIILPPLLYDDYKTKLCREQAEVIQNRLNSSVRAVGRGETMQRGLNSASAKPTTVQVPNCRLWVDNLMNKPALSEVFCISCINVICHS
jgi:hypothetical protein